MYNRNVEGGYVCIVNGIKLVIVVWKSTAALYWSRRGFFMKFIFTKALSKGTCRFSVWMNWFKVNMKNGIQLNSRRHTERWTRKRTISRGSARLNGQNENAKGTTRVDCDFCPRAWDAVSVQPRLLIVIIPKDFLQHIQCENIAKGWSKKGAKKKNLHIKRAGRHGDLPV